MQAQNPFHNKKFSIYKLSRLFYPYIHYACVHPKMLSIPANTENLKQVFAIP